MNSLKIKRILSAITATTILMAASSIHANILINFYSSGNAITDPVGWNNISSDIAILNDPLSLVDSTGAATAITATVTERFGGSSNSSLAYTGSNPNFIAAATTNGLYGNDVSFSGIVAPNPTVVFEGLNPALTYNFEIYGSRSGVSDIRTGVYTFTGANSGFDILDASSNSGNTASITGIQPDIDGNITFVMTKHESNTNGTGFIYIAAMEITAVPEPATYAALLGLFACGIVFFRRRR